MRLTRRTRLGDLLEAHPAAAAVFDDNDIELDDVDPESPLSSVARQYELDVEELLAELREELDDGGFDDDFGVKVASTDDDEEDDDFDDEDEEDDEDDDFEDGDDGDDLGDDFDDYDDDYDDEEESEEEEP